MTMSCPEIGGALSFFAGTLPISTELRLRGVRLGRVMFGDVFREDNRQKNL